MRDLIFMMSISLDGFMEGPNQEIDWHVIDDEFHQYLNDELRTKGAFLGGRKTHELMASFWPTAARDFADEPTLVEFSGIWLEKPKIVYSRTLQHADWNTTVVRDVIPDEVRALKEQPGGDLLLGGAEVAESFMRQDLIDEYRLYIHPVAIGAGKRWFQPDIKLKLRLAETRPFTNGVVLLRYRRNES